MCIRDSHVSLTAQGELFLLHANEILQAKDAACNAMKTQTQLTGKMCIRDSAYALNLIFFGNS